MSSNGWRKWLCPQQNDLVIKLQQTRIVLLTAPIVTPTRFVTTVTVVAVSSEIVTTIFADQQNVLFSNKVIFCVRNDFLSAAKNLLREMIVGELLISKWEPIKIVILWVLLMVILEFSISHRMAIAGEVSEPPLEVRNRKCCLHFRVMSRRCCRHSWNRF